MLHGQPAVFAVLHVRVDPEPELVDIKSDRLVLVAHVHTHYIYALVHRTSLSFRRPFLPAAVRRRFSETAVVRCGRCAALTMQLGTRPSSRDPARPRVRSVPGFSPVMSR